jgi:SNF2 family DNA or RNA helicase
MLDTRIRPIHDQLDLHIDRQWFGEFTLRVERGGPWDHWMLCQLAYEVEKAHLIERFDELLCLRYLPQLTPLPHQLLTAQRVIQDMQGRAILADEVGLGKTIEAGLIVKEYLVRQLIERVLILVPASLVLQWVRELNQKFNIPAIAHKKTYMWDSCSIIVASIDTAKKEPHRSLILAKQYDLLIIDEAHKLKNKNTTTYSFVNDIHKKFCLLLTATPMQNDLKELYHLINILKPGQLGEHSQFKSKFVKGKRSPKNEHVLHQEISKIMIRNRRSEGVLDYKKRIVTNILLELSPEEQELYDGVTRFVRERYQAGSNHVHSMLGLITLQREVCSSRDAVFLTLVHMFEKTNENSPDRTKIWDLVEKIKKIQANSKADRMIEIIKQSSDKVIVFTEYRATQEYLLHHLKQHGISAVPYRGGMNRGKKDWMMDLFRDRSQVLVATEAGGEGINLQFCHRLINFDLPWNPMRIEQRIGRIHRLGQTHDVFIYNLSTRHTIEEHIVHLLHEKINMFEKVIGNLDTIVERLPNKQSLEVSLFTMMMEATNEDEVREKVEAWGEHFHQVVLSVDANTANHNILDTPVCDHPR